MLIAHGSRNAEANDELHALSSELGRNYEIVEPAFLEIATPTIDDAALRCVEQGAKCVILTPYFLSAGIHVERDLAEHRARLALVFVDVEWRLAKPLGGHPLLREIVLDRIKEKT